METSVDEPAKAIAQETPMLQREILPALNAKPDAAVIANEFSCRQQLRAHGDHRARHRAVWLRELLSL